MVKIYSGNSELDDHHLALLTKMSEASKYLAANMKQDALWVAIELSNAWRDHQLAEQSHFNLHTPEDAHKHRSDHVIIARATERVMKAENDIVGARELRVLIDMIRFHTASEVEQKLVELLKPL